MVSNAGRRYQGLAALGCALAVAATVGAGANGQKFYPDNPITRIVDAADASSVQEREIDLAYDTLENLFSWPGDQTPNVRAQNVNTIDEVPDSTWFTNRLGTVPVTVDELVEGPGAGIGPGAWRLGGDFGQERWRDAGVHRPRFRRAGLVRQVRSARLPCHGDRHGGRRREDLLGAGLSRSRDAPGDAAAGRIDD